MVDYSCPVCDSDGMKLFFEKKDVPIHGNILWKTQKEAQNCPRGDIKLAFCPTCGYITNIEFNEKKTNYSEAYDTSRHFSPIFKKYVNSLAIRLIERYNLYNKNIIEIGCGKGYFLKLICRLGNNHGIGFDPSYIDQNDDNLKNDITFVKDFYSEKYSNYQSDLIISRQVLEHIQDPKEFLIMLRNIIGDKSQDIFFEVPNELKIFKKLFIWDIIYEHNSYFTPPSLQKIFSLSGFNVIQLTEEFKGQFLCAEGKTYNKFKANSICSHQNISEVFCQYIKDFNTKYNIKMNKYIKMLQNMNRKRKKVIVWGAGSKGVTLLNTFKDFNLNYAIDVNPNKQGKYVSETGQEIKSPEFLKIYKPDLVIIANPIYESEIRKIIQELRIKTKIILG